MGRGFKIVGFFLFIGLIVAFKSESKFLKKAALNIEKGNLKLARNYYVRALAINPDSFEANLGLGIMLSYLQDNFKEGLPYLEKALSLSQKDTLKDLSFALAECYQHTGEFEKAIYFYSQLDGCIDYDNEIDLTVELQKRIDDCHYAMAHKDDRLNGNIFIVNAGRTINTEMPEYVPVLTPQGGLIFTSKRKDTKNEELNYMDGKYYESMYITKTDSLGYKTVRRYTIPDHFLSSHFSKYHESVISLSPDGTKLFTYRNNKIYEITIKDRSRVKPKKLVKTINFNYYQNHAFVNRDGKTLYFTSDAAGGIGGNDIYKSVKNEQGEWGKPENLGSLINTTFDEESPFLSEDGQTLYFSSRGHEGFGNLDVYKSTLENGQWSKPENMGKPINSPGKDVFMINDSTTSIGYFSSSRSGGFGDMDIYKIIYIDKIKKTCPAYNNSPIFLSIADEHPGDLSNRIVANVPANYKVLSYEWKLDGVAEDSQTSSSFEKIYPAEGKYTISSRVVALCDTCLTPVISCLAIDNDFTKKTVSDNTGVIVANTPGNVRSELPGITPAHNAHIVTSIEAQELGFKFEPVLFDFNKADLRPEVLSQLAKNAEVLKKNPSLKVNIMGYTDVRGTDKFNQYISTLRAARVKDYFIQHGVKPSQIKAVRGLSTTSLSNHCATGVECDDALHMQNRRVIFGLSR